jgi:hypothetical protein
MLGNKTNIKPFCSLVQTAQHASCDAGQSLDNNSCCLDSTEHSTSCINKPNILSIFEEQQSKKAVRIFQNKITLHSWATK